MGLDAGDLIAAVAEVVECLRKGEIEAAASKLASARDSAAAVSVETRRTLIHEINRQIALLRAQRRRVELGVSEMPEDLRFEAEHRLVPVLDELFAGPIAELKKQKRRLSRPR